eukprot:m.11841 g.11841  ORF g.11841 m.11841 type:complete len:317 (-) comp4533_c0_seq1:683-1633(-)
MCADVTSTFRAFVKRLDSKHKSVKTEPSVSAPKKSVHDFMKRAGEVRQGITEFRNFLGHNARDYVGAARFVRGKENCLSDSERDVIDSEARNFLQTVSKSIQPLRQVVPEKDEPDENESVRVRMARLVVWSLETYYKKVVDLYSALQSARVKHDTLRARLIRTAPLGQKLRRRRTQKKQASNKITKPKAKEKRELANDFVRDSLSNNEIENFKQENVQMCIEMNSMETELEQVGNKVEDIARLNQEFANSISAQKETISFILGATSDATSNVVEGNQIIRKATKDSNDLRWGVVFFMLMCSFCLLFLEWHGNYSGR